VSNPTPPRGIALLVSGSGSRSLRRLLSLAMALGLLLTAAGTAAAMPPEGDRLASASGAGPVIRAPKPTRGYDISYPQCGKPYPANPLFGVVGVNGGRVFSVNSCLASQITWGGRTAAELYANTGNPGPASSSYWPKGQTTPKFCDANNADTADCAYDYGWNAAKHSFDTAKAAYTQLGITTSPAATRWWFDVETMNSWRSNVGLNVAALQGGVAYLQSVGVTKLGFYSTTAQWTTITGGTKVFSPMPSWGAGAPSEKAAKQHCISTPGFTGGKLFMVQFILNGFDADIRC
jgi:hypothetical protein